MSYAQNKGSKNKPKTVTADFATQIAEKQSAKEALSAEIASPTTHHALVQAALADFNLHERYLLEANLSERCICARFAMYLEKQLPAYQAEGYTVDVEYNRGMDGHDRSPKRLNDDLIIVDMKRYALTIKSIFRNGVHSPPQ